MVTLLACGCGRFGFDSRIASDAAGDGEVVGDSGDSGDSVVADDSSDAGVTFVEPVGMLDTTFGTNGMTLTTDGTRSIELYGVIPRAGGYLAVGVHQMATTASIVLIGYTVAGQLDAAFHGDGIADVGATLDDYGYGAIRIDANRILINGDGDDGTGINNDDITLGVIDDSGMPDLSFGTAGYVRRDFAGMQRADTANRATVVGSTVIACGVSGYDLIDSRFALARFDLTGAQVLSWGIAGEVLDDFTSNAKDECNDVIGLGNRVIAVGSSAQALVVAAYDNVTGARDPTFATGGVFLTGSGTAHGIAIVEGDLVIASDTTDGAHVLRLAADGIPRSGFGLNGQVSLPAVADVFYDVIAQPNGKLLVVGALNDRGIVARLLSDGSLDPTFGTAGVVELPSAMQLVLTTLSLDADGGIVVVGLHGNSTPYGGLAARIR